MVSAISSAGAIPERILDALSGASARTGEGFDYLLKTAMRESALDPDAAAPTSSARGLFQFVEQTWLGTVKQTGQEHGLAAYADQITQTASGRFTVSDPDMRREVLALRSDPAIAAVMAGELTASNRSELKSGLGREPTDGELYIAHFLGSAGATKLISSAARNPDQRADLLFPAAARANRSIFYSPGGAARSTNAVYHALVAKHETRSQIAAPAVTAQPQPPTVPQEAAAGTDPWSGVADFFQTLFSSLANLFEGNAGNQVQRPVRPVMNGVAGYAAIDPPLGGSDAPGPGVAPGSDPDVRPAGQPSASGNDVSKLAKSRSAWLHSLFLTGGLKT